MSYDDWKTTPEPMESVEDKSADLLDIIGHDKANDPRYCSQSPDPIGWLMWEVEVGQPALEAFGYRVIRWDYGERDSFGPLTRIVIVKKDGKRDVFVYG